MTLEVFAYATKQRRFGPSPQYASSSFRELLNFYQVTPSMSRKACCYDNAAMESFWATLKTECFHDQIPLNLKHAQALLCPHFRSQITYLEVGLVYAPGIADRPLVGLPTFLELWDVASAGCLIDRPRAWRRRLRR